MPAADCLSIGLIYALGNCVCSTRPIALQSAIASDRFNLSIWIYWVLLRDRLMRLVCARAAAFCSSLISRRMIELVRQTVTQAVSCVFDSGQWFLCAGFLWWPSSIAYLYLFGLHKGNCRRERLQSSLAEASGSRASRHTSTPPSKTFNSGICSVTQAIAHTITFCRWHIFAFIQFSSYYSTNLVAWNQDKLLGTGDLWIRFQSRKPSDRVIYATHSTITIFVANFAARIFFPISEFVQNSWLPATAVRPTMISSR